MLRTLSLTAVLLAACSGTTRAAEPTSDKSLTEREMIADIRNRLIELQRELVLRQGVIGDQLKELQGRIDAIEQRLNAREGAVIRRSPPSLSGRIMLQNRSAYPATITVDGAPISVPPFENVSLGERPVGPITYQVYLGGYGLVQPLTTRTLTPDRPFTIYINP